MRRLFPLLFYDRIGVLIVSVLFLGLLAISVPAIKAPKPAQYTNCVEQPLAAGCGFWLPDSSLISTITKVNEHTCLSTGSWPYIFICDVDFIANKTGISQECRQVYSRSFDHTVCRGL